MNARPDLHLAASVPCVPTTRQLAEALTDLIDEALQRALAGITHVGVAVAAAAAAFGWDLPDRGRVHRRRR